MSAMIKVLRDKYITKKTKFYVYNKILKSIVAKGLQSLAVKVV